jgi:hypothetical protein
MLLLLLLLHGACFQLHIVTLLLRWGRLAAGQHQPLFLSHSLLMGMRKHDAGYIVQQHREGHAALVHILVRTDHQRS